MIVRLLLLAVGFVITIGPFIAAVLLRAREQERRDQQRPSVLERAADYHDPYAQYRRSQP